MKIDFTIFGGRTYLMTVGCGVVTSVMRWFEHLDNQSWTLVTMGTVGAYIAAQTVQKHGEIRADVQKTIAAAQVAASPPSIVEQV